MNKPYNQKSTIVCSIAKPIGIGVLLGTISCIVMLLIISATASGIDIPPAAVLPLATLSAAFGALVAGYFSAKASGKNGWLMGILSSFMLFLISIVAGLSLFKEFNTSFVFIKLLIMLACGIVGGIIALNSGKRKHR